MPFFLAKTVFIKPKLFCSLEGGNAHIVGFLEVYRKFISAS